MASGWRFNSVLRAHEITSNISSLPCDKFWVIITICDLVRLRLEGVFTLGLAGENGIVLSCLDMAPCSLSFLDVWSRFSCVTLLRLCSNHHSLLISCSMGVFVGLHPFRFQGMWVSHPSFLDLVRSVWSSSVLGSGTIFLVQKLKLLKTALRRWNWKVFGDVVLNTTKANDRVMAIQERIRTEGFLMTFFRLSPTFWLMWIESSGNRRFF